MSGAAALSYSLVIPGSAGGPGQSCGFQMSLMCSQVPVCPFGTPQGEGAGSVLPLHPEQLGFFGSCCTPAALTGRGLLSNVSGQASLIPDKQEFNRRL